MKVHLLLAVCLFPIICIAQKPQKKNNVQPSTPSFLDISGGVLIVNNSDDVTPIGMLTFGPLLGKSKMLGVGISGGYFKYKGYSKPVIPFGIKMLVLPFKSNKISPVLEIGGYYPIYSYYNQTAVRTGTTTIVTRSEGKGIFMGHAAIGFGIPASKNFKVKITGSYNPYISRFEVKQTASGNSTTSEARSTINQFAIMMGFVFHGKTSQPKK
jgi:hypothetical protein